MIRSARHRVAEVDPHPVVVIAADGPAARRAATERAGLLFGPDHEHVVVESAADDIRSVCDLARDRHAVGMILGVTLAPGDRGRAPWVVRAVRHAPCPVILVVEDG